MSKQSLIARNTHAYTPLHWATHEQLTYMEISTQLKTERVLRNLTTHNDINVTNNPSSLGILTHRNLATHGGINVTNNPSSRGILTHHSFAFATVKHQFLTALESNHALLMYMEISTQLQTERLLRNLTVNDGGINVTAVHHYLHGATMPTLASTVPKSASFIFIWDRSCCSSCSTALQGDKAMHISDGQMVLNFHHLPSLI